MQRRNFLIRAGGIALGIATSGDRLRASPTPADRVGLGTVTLRGRFDESKLKLVDVPEYYRGRFGVRLLEFWSKHFESLEPSYLAALRRRIRAAGAELVNIQVDEDYDLASSDESRRQQSLETVRRWIEAAATLRSRAIRINPGRTGGSVEHSIASMKEVNRLCRAHRLPLLTENHFGIEMDPQVHLQIRAAAGPENVYTLPDFGNYPFDSMRDSLAKILPFAYVVSAKTVDFDAEGRHLSYDFERCLRLCEDSGFKGIYLVEQWSREVQPLDAERIADWMLEKTRGFLREPARALG